MSENQPVLIQQVHKLNDLLHKEPIASIAEGFYWYLVLLIFCPIGAFYNIFYAAYQVAHGLFWKKYIVPDGDDYKDKELAVVITGCDSGFGKDLVFSLASKGFIVFAACLQKESFEQFQGEPKILPLQMDVTKEEDVENAAKAVTKWLEAAEEEKKDEPAKQRYLHALVNNAGTGIAGLTDWMKVSHFEFIMNVNFFGPVRCVAAFLPLLKRQVSEGTYTNGRIVNMVSTAGLFSGGIVGAAYESSKYALEAYTINLRVELSALGIKVCAVNPGLHKTPLAEGKTIAAGMKKVWDAMTPEHRAEYGEDYFQEVSGRFEKSSGKFSWDKKYVVESLEQAVVSHDPPARYLVGLDAKYILYPFSKLPTSFRFNYIRTRPAMLDNKKTKSD